MTTGIVKADKLNLREKVGGRVGAVLLGGTEVRVTDAREDWSQVQVTGWVSNRYLNESLETEQATSGKRIRRIVIHCSATKPKQNFTAADINSWHTSPKSEGGRGWSRAGYHWVIERNPCRVMPLVAMDDDEVLEPREIANGARGYNRDSIHVCYVGGLNARGKPAENITKEQTQELIALLNVLTRHRPHLKKIVGHNDLNPMKACPSFDVAKFLHKHCQASFANKYA